MAGNGELRVIDVGAAASGRLSRRELVQRLLAGVGAGAAWPLLAASHPVHKLLRDDGVLDEAEKLGVADWKPLVLNAQENESLIAIAESIVPGSTKAEVNRFIDLLLSVDTAEHRQKLADSLAAFEAASQKRYGKGFPSLDAHQQNMLLTDTAVHPAREDSSSGAGKENLGLREHFENLKGWISGAYYSSEAGMRELGWTGDQVFERFPGCEDTEGHQ